MRSLIVLFFATFMVVSSSADCPDDWISFTDPNGQTNCYKHLTEHRSYQDQQDQCLALGSNLASIHSREENEFVVGSFGYYNWLGFRREFNSTSDDGWAWEDGSDVDFTNWFKTGML